MIVIIVVDLMILTSYKKMKYAHYNDDLAQCVEYYKSFYGINDYTKQDSIIMTKIFMFGTSLIYVIVVPKASWYIIGLKNAIHK